jgi:hypothetical protein
MGSNPVNGDSAYPDEMNAEAIIFVDAVRAAVPTRPDPRLGAALVPRLAATARASTLEAETRSMRRGTTTTVVAPRQPRSHRALVARVAIAVALIPLVFAGLAVAGVTVPSPARSAFDAVGIKLPNQPSKSSEHKAKPQGSQAPVGTTGTTTSPTTTEGNSDAAHQHALEQHAKAKGKAKGHSQGKAIGLNDGVPPGQSGDTGPPAHSNAGGNGRGVANGLSKTPPGHTKTPPGHSKTPPGQAKTPPGQAKVPPGQAKKG